MQNTKKNQPGKEDNRKTFLVDDVCTTYFINRYTSGLVTYKWDQTWALGDRCHKEQTRWKRADQIPDAIRALERLAVITGVSLERGSLGRHLDSQTNQTLPAEAPVKLERPASRSRFNKPGPVDAVATDGQTVVSWLPWWWGL